MAEATGCEECASSSQGITLVTDKPFFLLKIDCKVTNLIPDLPDDAEYLAFCYSEASTDFSPETEDLVTFCGKQTVGVGDSPRQITLTSAMAAATAQSDTVVIGGRNAVWAGSSIFHRMAQRICDYTLKIECVLMLPYGDSYDLYEGVMTLTSATYNRVAGASGDASITVDYSDVDPIEAII